MSTNADLPSPHHFFITLPPPHSHPQLVRYLRLGVVSELSAFVAPEFADLCNRIGAGDGDTAGQRHLVSGTGGTNCPDLKSYILLSHGKEVLFGGRSLWEIFVKINTRVVPLIYAPQRVKAAFK